MESAEGATAPAPSPASIAAETPPMATGQVTPHDDILFRGTDAPDEPLTHGSPFGPGASFVRGSQETDRQFIERAAETVANSPGATSRVRAFAARVARGE